MHYFIFKNQKIYILTQKQCDIETFAFFIETSSEEFLAFLSPAEMTHALGAVYWQEKLLVLQNKFPQRNIQIWLEFYNAPGHVLGALRMGVRHIFFQGKSAHFQKIKSLAAFYKADIQSLEKSLTNI